MNPLVSFAITVKDEFAEFAGLVHFLKETLSQVSYEWEVVVLVDGRENRKTVVDLVPDDPRYNVRGGTFDGDFAAWKNLLSSYCEGEYILQIDADELPPERVVLTLDFFLKKNPTIDLFAFPRLNVVDGIQLEDLVAWGWKTSHVHGFDLPVVQWPDYQGRLYRRDAGIFWTRPVHEVITGNRSFAQFPPDWRFAFIHRKTIARQREQNGRYSKYIRTGGLDEKGGSADSQS